MIYYLCNLILQYFIFNFGFMENVKDVFDEIKIIESQSNKLFARLEELTLIQIWCDIAKKSKAYYQIEENFVRTQIKSLKERLEELRDKEIVWMEWGVK